MAYDTVLADSLKAKIGNYEIITDAGAPEDPLESHQRIKAVLNDDGLARLCNVNNKNIDEKRSKKAREKLIDKLMEVLEANGNSFADTGICNPDGSDIRETNPSAATIDLKKLLGEEGLTLYQAAIEEEKDSPTFREAVFLSSMKHYPGAKWDKRLILWIAGPSASGKSYTANTVIEKLKTDVMESINGSQDGNHVVSVDGGIERELSQMRQLVLQIALKKGYTGISDLQKNTNLSIKRNIREAALSTKDLSLVIPCTFTSSFHNKAMRKYSRLSNTVHAFSEIVGEENNPGRFRRTVHRMGNTRAWKSSGFDAAGTTDRVITMNNRQIECESKKYNPRHFHRGIKLSAMARLYFQQINKDQPYLRVTNDLIFVKLENNNWVECNEKYPADCVKMAARDFQKWHDYKSGHLDGLPKDLSARDWLTYRQKHALLSPPIITLTRQPAVNVSRKDALAKTHLKPAGTLFALHEMRKRQKKLETDSTPAKLEHHNQPFLPLASQPLLKKPRKILSDLDTHIESNTQSLLKIKETLEKEILKFNKNYLETKKIHWDFQVTNKEITVSNTDRSQELFAINEANDNSMQLDFKTSVDNEMAKILIASLKTPIVVSSTSSHDIIMLSRASQTTRKSIAFDEETIQYINDQNLNLDPHVQFALDKINQLKQSDSHGG
jgi:hypothetical protein